MILKIGHLSDYHSKSIDFGLIGFLFSSAFPWIQIRRIPLFDPSI